MELYSPEYPQEVPMGKPLITLKEADESSRLSGSEGRIRVKRRVAMNPVS